MTDEWPLVRVVPGADVAVVSGEMRVLVRPGRPVDAEQIWKELVGAVDLIDPADLAEFPTLDGAASWALVIDTVRGPIRVACRGDGRATVRFDDGRDDVVAGGRSAEYERDRVAAVELWNEGVTTVVAEDVERAPTSLLLQGGVCPAERLSWTLTPDGPRPASEPATIDEGATRVRSEAPAQPTAEPPGGGERHRGSHGRVDDVVPERRARAAKPFTGMIDAVPELTASPSTALDVGPVVTGTRTESGRPDVADESTRVRMPVDESTNVRASGPGDAASNMAGWPTARPERDDVMPAADVHAPKRVQALLCVRRHPNPTHSMRCSICGDALGEVPESIIRPSLGVLRFTDGQLVPLDRPIVIGRSPSSIGDVEGERPRRIALPDAAAVSANHLLIRLEGWNAYLEDLGSSNGTEATLPDRDPIAIRPGQLLLVEPGTQVRLADDASFVFDLQDMVP